MLSGCYQLMWAHSHLIWFLTPRYYQLMWSRKTDVIGSCDLYYRAATYSEALTIYQQLAKENPALRDRSRVVPRSDRACVFTKRFLRSENAGFPISRRVIGEHVSHPLVGWRTSDQDGWGLRSNLICRGIFEDFHAGSKGNLYSKIATPRRCICLMWR